MKPIIIENTVTLTTSIKHKTQLTEEIYNALLKKYKVEIDEDNLNKYSVPTFDEYCKGLLNPHIVYKDFPYEPYIRWHYYRGRNYVSGYSEYYSGDWVEGYTREAGEYYQDNTMRDAIHDMIDREYHLYCHQKKYPVEDGKEYSFLPDEECVVPFEEDFRKKEAKAGRTEVDIPSKVEVMYYE